MLKQTQMIKRAGYVIVAMTTLFTFAANARAQQTVPTTEARITVVSTSPPRVRVEGARGAATRVWSFRNSYAGVMNLGERIESLALSDSEGRSVLVRGLAPGEYEAERDAIRFSYEIKLDPPTLNTDAAHVSWLTEQRGALMLGDLLPLPLARAHISFKLQDGWGIVSSEKNSSTSNGATKTGARLNEPSGIIEDFADAESAIIFAARDARVRDVRADGMDVRVAIAGEWAFTDQEIDEMIVSIIREHAKTFGGVPGDLALVVVSPPPHAASPAEWSAETRGATVFCLAGRAPSRVSAVARLTTPLAHELFHLWIPNALALTGEYAWFYEGFTNYQALRASQRLNFLNFDDYLAALARAYDSYELMRETDTLSLVEASARRWSGTNALVYHKGMLAAAIYDLNLRSVTRGKRSLDDVYRELFRRARTVGDSRDGNTLVLDTLKSVAGGRDFAARLVVVPHKIDLGSELSTFGLTVETFGASHQVIVANSLSGWQRDLLRQVGYNR
jgi:hypothetical protein